MACSNLEVLDEWAEFVNYDEDQKKFYFGSLDYIGHRSAERVKELNRRDPTNSLAVIYIRDAYLDWLSDKRLKLIDLVEDPTALDEVRDHIDMLHVIDDSYDVVKARYRAMIERIAQIPRKPLLDGETERGVDDSGQDDQYDKCNSQYGSARAHDGNSILDRVDAVAELRHPLERGGSMNEQFSRRYEFSISLGVSKRRLNKAVRKIETVR